MTDNELIAEFMRLRICPDNNRAYWIEAWQCYINFDVLSYHQSWDWLMPVVEKIAKDGYDTYIAVDGLSSNHKCYIGTTTDIYAETEGSWCLEVVYTCVVKFIKWYNSTK